MEPLSSSINDSAINSKYDYILNSSRVLTIPIVRCDDPVLNRFIKQEFIDEMDINNEHLLIRPKCEPEEEIYPTKIKTEMDLNEIVVFEGSVNNEFYPSELTTQIKLEETSNLRKRLSNSSDFQVNHRFQTNHNNKKCNISDKLSNSKALFTRHSKTHTTKRIKQFICDNCGKSYNTKSDLTTHILLCCTERKLYTSFICDKGVSQAGDLKKYRPKCEPEEEIYPTKIKTEMDLNEIVVFEGSVNNEFYPSELTTQIKLEETSNLRKRLSNSSDFQVNHRFQTNHNNKKCNISDKLSNSKALFTRHSKTHTTKRIKQFICDNCGKSYNTKSDLTTHILLCCTERKLYTSFICDKGVSQAGDLKKYRPKCEPEEEIYPTKIKTEMDLNEIVVFEGSVNNEFYPSELTTQIKLEETSNLRKRLSNSSDFQVNHRFQTNHNNKKCNISDKLSNSKALFTRHSKTHTTKRIKQFICDNCGKSYNTKSDLTTHILLCCTERKLYTSFICDKGVSQAGDLKNYKRPHTGIKSFKCDICDKGFSDPGYLRKHKITHTGIKPYICDICKKGFAQKINLKNHLRTHTGDKSYECDICGKKYYQKSNLTTHSRGHTGYKPHECNICDKKFPHLGHLIRHTRTHTGDRPFKCDACDKGFYQSSNLKRHMMTHTRVKPYKCVTCDKKFAHSCSLKRHTYIHTGFKPHKCVYCDKRFIQSQELKNHILKHTREKPYACNICDKRFTQSGTLKNHKRTHT